MSNIKKKSQKCKKSGAVMKKFQLHRNITMKGSSVVNEFLNRIAACESGASAGEILKRVCCKSFDKRVPASKKGEAKTTERRLDRREETRGLSRKRRLSREWVTSGES